MALFLIISFLIHILTLIGLFKLFKQVMQKRTNQMIEIETLLRSHLADVQYENEQLKRHLASNESDHVSLEQDANGLVQADSHDYIGNKVDYNLNDFVETSIEAQTLQLYGQGYSVSQIAQKLNRGKTEISLIIELRKS